MQYISTPVSGNLLHLHDSHKTPEDNLRDHRRGWKGDAKPWSHSLCQLPVASTIYSYPFHRCSWISCPKILLQPLTSTFFLQIPCAAMRTTTSLCLRVASSCRAWSGPPGTSEAKGEEIKWCFGKEMPYEGVDNLQSLIDERGSFVVSRIQLTAKSRSV